jgi:hypothetical protein
MATEKSPTCIHLPAHYGISPANARLGQNSPRQNPTDQVFHDIQHNQPVPDDLQTAHVKSGCHPPPFLPEVVELLQEEVVVVN